jgi:serine/threonine-protein kinase RsbW
MAVTNNHNLTIALRIPSRLELLGVLDKVVEGVADQMEFEDMDRDAIAIAVVEAGTNAIQHGHYTDPQKPVDITFDLGADQLIITIRDEGTGFNPDIVADTTPPPDLLSTRGRGIFIMRAMMDDVSFDFSDGTLVRMVKNRTPVEKDTGGGTA